MKQEDNDRLKALFHEIKPAKLTIGFESRLMSQIQNLEKKRTKQARMISIGWLSAGIVTFIALAISALYLTGWSFSLKEMDLASGFRGFELTKNNCVIISVSCVSLALLMGDTLLHKRSREKKYKDE